MPISVGRMPTIRGRFFHRRCAERFAGDREAEKPKQQTREHHGAENDEKRLSGNDDAGEFQDRATKRLGSDTFRSEEQQVQA